MNQKTPTESGSDVDIEKRLEHIEAQLDNISAVQRSGDLRYQSQIADDEIDLRELWEIIWRGKWIVTTTTLVFVVVSVVYALIQPNLYKSEGVYVSSQQESGLGGLASKYGGLVAMAGIDFGGGESGDIDQAIALLKSWPFIERFVNKYQLKPYIMGAKKWNESSNSIIWHEDIYDSEKKRWVREPARGGRSEPSSYEVYKEFSKLLSVSNDAKTGLITVSMEYYSPVLARSWTVKLISELNRHFQERDMISAKTSIDYLNKKISETVVSEMRSVFYEMVEEQTKNLMLAEVSEEYLIKTLIEPKVAELKSRPKRSLIVVLACVLGGMLSISVVLIRYFIQGSSK